VDEPTSDVPPNAPRKRGPKASTVIVAVASGTLGALALVFVLSALARRDSMPDLTEAAIDEAQARWRNAAIDSYNLDLTLSGRTTGDFHLEVRSGEVVAMTRNGIAPKQRRTWSTWVVPNQFDYLRQELNGTENPAVAWNAPPGAMAVLRAEFDPQYGYPRRYHREVLGASLEQRWEVTRFEVVGPNAKGQP
jgi:hypothetical protein